MKILLSSYAFYPSIGGHESLSSMLAEQFCARGHEVVVLTNTTNDREEPDTPYRVARRPNNRELFFWVKWCDIFLHNDINLRSSWPLLVLRRPWVIINGGSINATAMGKLKRFCAAHFAVSCGVSEDAAKKIGTKLVIPNCYDNDLFYEIPSDREIDLVYLGRLVLEKGVEVLLRALSELKISGLAPSLTIIGTGPEEDNLRRMADSLGVSRQVEFIGPRRGAELVGELNRHKILVVPSVYDEAFGIVAIEAIASGCVVIGSDRGGLKVTIGPCGLTFPSGDHVALAESIRHLLVNPAEILDLHSHATEHVSRFTKEKVASAYLDLFHRVCSHA